MKGCGVLLCLAFVAAASARVSYDGYQVWRINLDEKSAPRLGDILKSLELDVFAEGRGFADVSVSPQMRRRLSTSLARQRIQFNPIVKNLGDLIQEEEKRIHAKPLEFTLTDYNTFEDIEGYLAGIDASSPYASLASLGQSVEGRDLWQLKLAVGGVKPSVWIDCGIHAREWITPATCLYGIDYLLGAYGTDADVTALLDAYDMYIMPVNNPDGYSYTWSDDRMWRKNRNRYNNTTCAGIDLNRNFDDNFGGEGTSSSPCSDLYRGPFAASEPETQATQNGIKNLIATADLKILYSIHSYSQLWMYPYGYTSTVVPPEAAELDANSKIGVDALTAVYGTQFVYGPIATTIYPAASTTIDYSYAQGVVNSFTLELRDTGEFGFILPSDQITPVGEETWAGLIAAILATP